MTCPYCAAESHQGTCPRIKVIEYHLDGTIKRIEFFSIADQYPATSPLYPANWYHNPYYVPPHYFPPVTWSVHSAHSAD